MKSCYIHIPFCKTICSYCDFCKFYYDKKWTLKYLEQLQKEIALNYKDEKVNTIYIGGGTPTSLDYNELKYLLDIVKKLRLNNSYEYTIEANVETLDLDKIKLLKEYGINRVSIGVESIVEKNIKFLDRHHTKEDVVRAIDLLKQEGINNINIDLIYALPHQTIDDLKVDLDFFLSLDIPHISTYSLMIEPNTVLSINGTLPISDSLDKKMYDVICNTLKKEGYIHYEVSNFAKEGFYSKHNSAYWLNDNYYGFGLGASGYIDNLRYTNTKNLTLYLKGNYISQKEILTKDDEITYALILGFRFIKGIDIEKFKERYNVDLLANEKVKKLLRNKKLVLNNGSISINKKYIYVENEVLIEFI